MSFLQTQKGNHERVSGKSIPTMVAVFAIFNILFLILGLLKCILAYSFSGYLNTSAGGMRTIISLVALGIILLFVLSRKIRAGSKRALEVYMLMIAVGVVAVLLQTGFSISSSLAVDSPLALLVLAGLFGVVLWAKDKDYFK